MTKKRERTERREREREARKLVRVKERLSKLERGGTQEHPIEVGSSAVVEVRIHGMQCPQCAGHYQIVDHRSAGRASVPST